MEKRAIYLKIDKEIIRAVKIICIQRGSTLQDYITAALMEKMIRENIINNQSDQ